AGTTTSATAGWAGAERLLDLILKLVRGESCLEVHLIVLLGRLTLAEEITAEELFRNFVALHVADTGLKIGVRLGAGQGQPVLAELVLKLEQRLLTEIPKLQQLVRGLLQNLANAGDL